MFNVSFSINFCRCGGIFTLIQATIEFPSAAFTSRMWPSYRLYPRQHVKPGMLEHCVPILLKSPQLINLPCSCFSADGTASLWDEIFPKRPVFITSHQLLSLLTWNMSRRAHCCHRRLTSDLTCCFFFSPLQRQVAGEVQMQPQDRAVNQIAMMLAILGLGLSYYSAKQMTENVQVQPAPWRKTCPAGEKQWAMRRWGGGGQNGAAFVVGIFQTSSQGQDGFYGVFLGRVIAFWVAI